MRRQNRDESQKILEELNQGFGEVLEQIPAQEAREKSYRGIDEVTEEDEDAPKKKKMTPSQVATTVLVGILAIVVVAGVALVGLRASGKKSLMASEELNITAPELDGQEVAVENNGDLVVYNGQKYCYNHNIINVLLMGIDRTQDERLEKLEDGSLIGNGQADTIILAALNSETGKISLLNISRDSMIDVDTYTSSGDFTGSKKMQLCLAYAYGRGEEGGSLNVARSVSRLLYGIPVSSYAAINLTAINVMNDAIGGVEVEVIEDLTLVDPELSVGNVVTLKGSQAEAYVRSRDAYFAGAESNNLRMDRQKQYLSAFAAKVLAQTKDDVSVPLTLFDVASEYMNTDLNAAKVSYLVSLIGDAGLEDSSFITVPGESVLGEHNYAEFNVDDKALYELILDIFYEKIDNE